MSEKGPIKEDTYDMAQAGFGGQSSNTAGWGGTFSSPGVSQNSDNFVGGKNQNNLTALRQKALGANSNTATGAPASGSQFDAAVDQIYSKEVTPSPDEVMTGLKYEMQNMIKKDKARAKEIVIGNLKQDPHYYGKLGMWNIDDKEMMNVQPQNQAQTPEQQMTERIKILDEMIKAKTKKAETPQSIKDALADTKAKKTARYTDR